MARGYSPHPPLTVAALKYLHLGRFGALAAGLVFVFSATAIAMPLLEERGDAQSGYGRSGFGALLGQDTAVVPVHALILLLGGSGASPSLARQFDA